jgi:hypothetical protein
MRRSSSSIDILNDYARAKKSERRNTIKSNPTKSILISLKDP